MLELAYRRARSVEDLEAALGVPVLGSISSAAGMFLPLKKRATA
jgi:capsular polysaccharide biosynthesis protein